MQKKLFSLLIGIIFLSSCSHTQITPEPEEKNEQEDVAAVKQTRNIKEEKMASFKETINLEDESFELDSWNYDNFDSMEKVINEVINQYGFSKKNLGIAYYNLVSGESYYLNENKAIHAASTNKVSTCVLISNLIKQHKLNWTTHIQANPSHFEEGAGDITNHPLKSSYTVDDLVYNALVYSDNTAWNILIDYYSKHVGDYWTAIIQQSKLKNPPESLKSHLNYATPRMLQNYLYQVATEDQHQRILNYLFLSEPNERFKLFVKNGMATKYGQYGPGYHDIGIYYDGKRPAYILVLMTRDIGTVDLFMGELNLRVNQYYRYQLSH